MFGVYFRETPPQTYAEVMTCDKERFNQFFHSMLAEGVYLAPSPYETAFLSTAHEGRDIDQACTVLDAAIRAL